MKLLYILFIIVTNLAFGQFIGYSGNIVIGPKRYFLGINLNTTNYPPNTAYNIDDPNNPTQVHDVIQQALTDIGNRGGGILSIKAGLYVSLTNLEIVGNKTAVIGEGIDKTIIKLSNYAPSFIVGTSKRSGFLRGRALSNIIVANLTLDGNKNNQYYDDDHIYGRYGLFTEGSDNIWFDSVKIINCQGYGFDPHGWKSNGIWGKYLTITNCISENNEWDGFTLDQTHYIYVSNCFSYNNGRHGFNIVTGSRYVTITNNIASYNGFYDPHGGSGCGFVVQNNQEFNTSDVTFDHNIAYNNKKAGIWIDGVHNIYFVNNTVNIAGVCFDIVDSSSSIFTGNLCLTKSFLTSSGSTIVTEPGTSPFVYVYNNTYVHTITSTTTTSSTSGTGSTSGTSSTSGTTSTNNTCVYRSMRCVTNNTYQTCNIYSNGTTYWDIVQNCANGLSCHVSGDSVYCF